jgi:hypothetical protein
MISSRRAARYNPDVYTEMPSFFDKIDRLEFAPNGYVFQRDARGKRYRLLGTEKPIGYGSLKCVCNLHTDPLLRFALQ